MSQKNFHTMLDLIRYIKAKNIGFANIAFIASNSEGFTLAIKK